jgi:ABC-type Na+ efflux pump permease subunit
MQRMMAWLLAGSVALSAAASFRRERESGVLELLLVSPMNESQIITGRLGGLWSQFLPSFALLLTVWAYFSTLFGDHKDGPVIAFHAITFLTLPVIGLCYSLGARNVLMAFLSTIAVGILIPLLLPTLFGFFWPGSAGTYVETVGQQSGIQTIFAIICWFKLHDRLKRRAFPLDRREA